MPKMPKESSKKLPNTTKPKDRTNTSGRKNKGQDEKKPENTGSYVRSRGPEEEILKTKKTRKKKEVEPEGIRVFKSDSLRSGDRFTFISPGKGNKKYICTVTGSTVVFERNDKHTYTRHLSEIPEIVRSCRLECTLIE
jgi:hypothetical protein